MKMKLGALKDPVKVAAVGGGTGVVLSFVTKLVQKNQTLGDFNAKHPYAYPAILLGLAGVSTKTKLGKTGIPHAVAGAAGMYAGLIYQQRADQPKPVQTNPDTKGVEEYYGDAGAVMGREVGALGDGYDAGAVMSREVGELVGSWI